MIISIFAYIKSIKIKKELIAFKYAVKNSDNSIVMTDKERKITYVNELFCEISGYNSDELIGKELKSLRYQDFSPDIYTNLYASVLNKKSWQGKLKNLKKDGTFYHTDAYVMPM